MALTAEALERFDRLDTELVDISKSIRVLSSLTWPRQQEEQFLQGWRQGTPRLPAIEAAPRDHRAEIEALEALMTRCDRSHPMGSHLYKTAWSYLTAARMVRAIGTAEFTQHSIRLYGRPDRIRTSARACRPRTRPSPCSRSRPSCSDRTR